MLLLVPGGYIKFDALEEPVLNQHWEHWVSQVKAGVSGRFRPVHEKPSSAHPVRV